MEGLSKNRKRKKLMNTDNSVVMAVGVGTRGINGDYDRDLTWGGEPTMQCTHDVS